MTKVMENAPSVEKIFAAVTTEIKPNSKGKYFVQIDDNWRMQSIRESFATLEDAVKIARIMHSELCKVSRLIYATVDARTIDINKYCFRADHWTTLFEIDDYGNEKIKHRDAIKAVAEIENRTVEEVTGDIGRTTEDYGIYHSTAKVEEVNATTFKYYLKSNRPIYGAVPSGYINAEKVEIRVPRKGYFYGVATYDKPLIAKQILDYDLRPEDDSEIEKVNNYMANCILINCLDDYIVDADAAVEVEEINADNAPKVTKFEVGKWYYDLFDSDKKPAYKVVKRTKKMLTLVDDFGEIIKKKISVDLGVEEIHIGGVNSLDETALKATAFCVNSDEIQKAEDDLSYSIAQDTAAEVEEVNAPAKNNPLQEKIAGLRTAEKIIAEKYLNVCQSLYVKIDGEYHSAVGFDDYVTKYHDKFYCKEGNDYVEDTAAYGELKAIESEWNAILNRGQSGHFESKNRRAEKFTQADYRLEGDL